MVSHQGQRDILRQNRVLPLRAGLRNRGVAHRLVVRAHREALPGIFVFHNIEPPENPPDVLLDAVARLLFDNQRVGAQRAVRQVVFFPPDVLLDVITRLLFDNQRVGAQGAVRQVVFFQKPTAGVTGSSPFLPYSIRK